MPNFLTLNGHYIGVEPAHPETVYEGLEQAPRAFADIFASQAGLGKVVIRVAAP